MTSCWAVIYAVPRGTLKVVAVSVKEDGSCSELQFFWIALGDDYVADRGYLMRGLSLFQHLVKGLKHLFLCHFAFSDNAKDRWYLQDLYFRALSVQS
jgi:hypothetical protein